MNLTFAANPRLRIWSYLVAGLATWGLVIWAAVVAKGHYEVSKMVEELRAPEASVRKEAAWGLGGTNDPRAVGPLILALKDTDSDVRYGAASSLGQIKDPRADQPLSLALKDSDQFVVKAAGRALGDIGDPQAVDYLLTALRTHNNAAIAAASAFYVGRGEPGSEDALIEALDKSGDQFMAAQFLNSGNQKLEDAAHAWAVNNGYEITYLPFGGSKTSWGGN